MVDDAARATGKPVLSRRVTAGLSLLSLALLAALALPASAGTLKPRLIQEQDFSKATALDPAFWVVETGFFRNKEAQYYRPANVGVKDGVLVLEGRREPAVNAAYDPNGNDWLTTTRSADSTSGSIVSRAAFTYGIVEVVARLPQGPGTWPAIWTVFEGHGPYREIDVVEAVGNSPGTAWSTVHAGYDQKGLEHWQAETPLPGLGKDFHTYRLEWRPDAIIISFDGRQVLNVDPEKAHKEGIDALRAKMHLRINLALGGSWGGKIDDAALPARIEIKSFKMWSFDR